MTELREDRVTADRVGIHYLEATPDERDGGPPVLLLHGGIIDAARLSWGGVLAPLADALGRPILAPDLAGYGDSDRPVAAYTTAYHVESMRAFLNALGITRVDLCGLSLGGGVALGLALADDRVERLVVADSFGLGTELPRGQLTWAVAQVPALNRLSIALLRRSERFRRASLAGLVADPDSLSEEVYSLFADLLERETPGHAFRQWRAAEVTRHGYATTYVPLLPELQQPALFIHGTEDDVFPARWSRAAADLAPDGEYAGLADCGHWPPRERPERFVELAAGFLGEE